MKAELAQKGVDNRKVLLQQLPSVHYLLLAPAARELVAVHGHTLVADCARALLLDLRQSASVDALTAGQLEIGSLTSALAERCTVRLTPNLRSVLNLTGTVIHTNLGRSVLADAALSRLIETMGSPNNLEFDLETGKRGDRDDLIESLLCEITGAEAATVVNNNAAAVMLTLSALARGREVLISRGELVEIGGAFRLPDVMEMAGATMIEVGTTNRTHTFDYANAINERTALIMKVHTSNYAVQGYTAAVAERDLAVIAHERGLPLATDLGSGSLIDLARYGLPHEPMPQEVIAAGCDVVTFSGDKLLGGPQAGLIVGTHEVVARIRKYPMKRALRVSKLLLAALEATLQLYLKPEHLTRDLPTLRYLTRPPTQIKALTDMLAPQIAKALIPRYTTTVTALSSQIGSGSLPVDRLPSTGLAISPCGTSRKGINSALDELVRAFRALPRPVIGRITQDRLLFDLRCLESADALVEQLPLLRASLGMELDD